MAIAFRSWTCVCGRPNRGEACADCGLDKERPSPHVSYGETEDDADVLDVRIQYIRRGQPGAGMPIIDLGRDVHVRLIRAFAFDSSIVGAVDVELTRYPSIVTPY